MDFNDIKFRARTAREAKDLILNVDLWYSEPTFWFNSDQDLNVPYKEFEIIYLITGHETKLELTKEDNYLGSVICCACMYHYFIVEGTPLKDMHDKIEEELEEK